VLGSRERKLRKGDLVFVDVGCAMDGYHTDKTMVYVFGGALPGEAVAAHQRCVEIEQRLAAQLKPGAIPSQIYTTTLNELDSEFLDNFMGFGNRRANFLGHGVGLQIDEPPVIAEGCDEPLVEGMTLAIEPKKGVASVGMVGTENTFAITSSGGRSLTGSHAGLLRVGC
jgi:Xaa-Pro aminopeptidase